MLMIIIFFLETFRARTNDWLKKPLKYISAHFRIEKPAK